MDAESSIRIPLRRRLRRWRHDIRNRNRIEVATRSTRPIILLHQMGKVGSSSIRQSLESLKSCRVFHTHWCNPKNLAKGAGVVNEDRRISNRYGDRDHFGAMVNTRIIQPGLASRMVTLVRDPVARNVSSYFQHLDEIWGVRGAWSRITITDLVDGFMRFFEHDEPLDWFDTEVRDLIGIDVMKHRFDHDKRYSIIRNGEWSVLMMRSDLVDEGKHHALERFLDEDVPSLRRENTTSSKPCAGIYTRFKKQLALPESYLDRMYASKLTTHFFTSAEIRTMRANWSMAA